MIIIVFLLRIGQVMNMGFGQIFNMYHPVTYGVGDIIRTYVYRIGILNSQFSLATAAGIINNAIGVSLLLVVNRMAKQFREFGVV